jgi:hypothetical protein
MVAIVKSVTIEIQAKRLTKFEDFIGLILVLVLMVMAVIVAKALTTVVSPLTVLLDDLATVVVAAKDGGVRRGWPGHGYTAAGAIPVTRATGYGY